MEAAPQRARRPLEPERPARADRGALPRARGSCPRPRDPGRGQHVAADRRGHDAGQGQRRVPGFGDGSRLRRGGDRAADGAAGRPRCRRRRRGAGVRAGRGAHGAAPVRRGDAPRGLPGARRRPCRRPHPSRARRRAPVLPTRRGTGHPDALPGPDRGPGTPAALRALRRSGPRAGTPRPRRSRDARGPSRRAAEGDLPRQPRPVRAGPDAGARAADHRDGGQGEPGARRGARGGRRQRSGGRRGGPDRRAAGRALPARGARTSRTRGRRAMPEVWTGRSRSSPVRAPGSGAPWRRSCCGAARRW